MDAVETFVREADGFMRRNQAEFGWNTPASAFGGVVWGFMRAIAECPRCPGIYRTPIGKANGFASDFDLLRCPECGGVWQHIGSK